MRIIDNFQLTIKNIHIRIEDSIYVETPYSFGLYLSQISLLTTNDDWSPIFIDRTSDKYKDAPIHKLLTITDMCIYLNNNEVNMYTTIASIAEMQKQFALFQHTNSQFIIKPFCLQAKLIYTENYSMSQPKFDLSLEMQSFDLELSKRQFECINSIINVATIYKEFQSS